MWPFSRASKPDLEECLSKLLASGPSTDIADIIGTVEGISDYRPATRPLPNADDDRISEAVHSFMKLPPEKRSVITGALSLHASDVLLVFSRRMAVLSVRTGSVERLIYGLLADVIEGVGVDYRDNLVTQSLLYYSARKLRLNARKLFYLARDFGSEKARKLIESSLFLGLGPQPPWRMGYRPVVTEDGFDYEWIDS